MQYSQYNVCLQVRPKLVKIHNYKDVRGINSVLYVGK